MLVGPARIPSKPIRAVYESMDLLPLVVIDIDADETPDVSLGQFMTSLSIYLESYCCDCK